MRKIYGAKERQDGLYSIGRDKYELIYGFGKDSEDDETGYNYRLRFTRKPAPEECVDIICNHINTLTDEKILNGFSWRGMSVWLSSENQFNYKAAYDLAVQSGGNTLPVKFKFGSDEAPEYFIFENLEDFSDFYLASSRYVNTILNDGWIEKDYVRKNSHIYD